MRGGGGNLPSTSRQGHLHPGEGGSSELLAAVRKVGLLLPALFGWFVSIKRMHYITHGKCGVESGSGSFAH